MTAPLAGKTMPSSPSDTPRFIDAKTLARAFGVPVGTVYALAREGVIPSVRLGRTLRFDVDQLEAFVQAGGAGFAGGWRREVVPGPGVTDA